MAFKALQRRAREARRWLFESCFPLWSDAGMHRDGRFHEALEASGKAAEGYTAETQTQAAQLAAFATAYRLGWRPETARSLCETGLGLMKGEARRSDGLYRAALPDPNGPGGAPDDTPDLAATASALAALAQLVRADERFRSPVQALTRPTVLSLDRALGDGRSGGYLDHLPRPQVRSEAAQRGLLEACLDLAGVDQAGGHMGRAGSLVALFLSRLRQPETGLVTDTYQTDWRPAAQDGFSPAVQLAWAVQLVRHARRLESARPVEADRLYNFACATAGPQGRIPDRCGPDGTVHDATYAVTAQAVALEAHLIYLDADDPDRETVQAACDSFDALMDDHLTREGGWIEAYDPTGQPVLDVMPAATIWPLVRALSALVPLAEA